MATTAVALVSLLATVAGTAGERAAHAQEQPAFKDLRSQRAITGDVVAGQTLAGACSACHGEQGIGISPSFPNLAGQSATYLYVQLASFKGGQRSDPVMAPMAAPLADDDMRHLAAWFASLPPRNTDMTANVHFRPIADIS